MNAPTIIVLCLVGLLVGWVIVKSIIDAKKGSGGGCGCGCSGCAFSDSCHSKKK